MLDSDRTGGAAMAVSRGLGPFCAYGLGAGSTSKSTSGCRFLPAGARSGEQGCLGSSPPLPRRTRRAARRAQTDSRRRGKGRCSKIPLPRGCVFEPTAGAPNIAAVPWFEGPYLESPRGRKAEFPTVERDCPSSKRRVTSGRAWPGGTRHPGTRPTSSESVRQALARSDAPREGPPHPEASGPLGRVDRGVAALAGLRGRGTCPVQVGVPSGTCTLFSRVGGTPGSGPAGGARSCRAAAVQRRGAEPGIQASTTTRGHGELSAGSDNFGSWFPRGPRAVARYLLLVELRRVLRTNLTTKASAPLLTLSGRTDMLVYAPKHRLCPNRKLRYSP